jgi:hypothetical protein
MPGGTHPESCGRLADCVPGRLSAGVVDAYSGNPQAARTTGSTNTIVSAADAAAAVDAADSAAAAGEAPPASR